MPPGKPFHQPISVFCSGHRCHWQGLFHAPVPCGAKRDGSLVTTRVSGCYGSTAELKGSPPTHHLLENTTCINPCGAQLRHPYPRVLSPHMQLKQLGKSPRTHFRRAKTRVLGSEGLELAASNLAVYILLENSFPWRKVARIWVREWARLLWGELEQNTRCKLFALPFQHVLV